SSDSGLVLTGVERPRFGSPPFRPPHLAVPTPQPSTGRPYFLRLRRYAGPDRIAPAGDDQVDLRFDRNHRSAFVTYECVQRFPPDGWEQQRKPGRTERRPAN